MAKIKVGDRVKHRETRVRGSVRSVNPKSRIAVILFDGDTIALHYFRDLKVL